MASGKQNYDDIIHLPHYVSSTRPQMSMMDRAAQFAPFAALTGHGDAVKETARLTEGKVELDENAREMLDRKIQQLLFQGEQKAKASITYFVQDSRKAGGAYVTVTGNVLKVDSFYRMIWMEDGTGIPISDIREIQESTEERELL